MPTPFVVVPGAALTDGRPVELPQSDLRRLRASLRLRDGDAVVVGDGEGTTVDAELGDGRAVPVADATRHPRPSPSLTLVQALPKGRKMDDVVRACTELGVDVIRPVAARRSVSRLDATRASTAVERWRQVALAACEQSRRPWAPRIDAPVEVATLGDVASRAGVAPTHAGRVDTAPAAVAVVAHPAAPTALRDALADVRGRGVTVAIGPEGGWHEDELRLMVALGARPVALGPTILRTEHAGAAFLAIAAYASGRLGAGDS